MIDNRLRLNIILILAAAGSVFTAYMFQSGSGKASAKTTMMQYLIISLHSPDECDRMVGDIAGQGADKLALWNWGCRYRNHTAYAFVDAPNEDAALQLVPAFVRDRAKALRVDKITMEDLQKLDGQHQLIEQFR